MPQCGPTLHQGGGHVAQQTGEELGTQCGSEEKTAKDKQEDVQEKTL